MSEHIFEKGYKNTPQRRLILSAFESKNQLLSANDIFEICLKKSPKLALSTIYRNLEILKKNHMIEETFIKEKNMVLYELVTHDHLHHMICLDCHQMIPVHDCHIDDISLDFANKHGFKIESHKLEFYGYCKNCSKQS
jgi:Fe2+ or Zn2+ uptake regulation protein